MIYTLGESLLDIIITSLDNTVARPGGAMLNTSVSLGRLNTEVSLITELGDDDTARLITEFLEKNKISLNYVTVYKNNNTSLAIAFLDENKKPNYTFIKKYPVNRKLLCTPNFKNNDILLFGSLYSLDKQIRNNILSIVNDAVINKATVIYDPNIRNATHLNDELLMNALLDNIKLSNIIKGSDEDFSNIFRTNNISSQIAKIREINNQAFVIITLGADGVIADYKGQQIKIPAIGTNVISTIGAGDAFNAGIIYALNQIKINQIDFEEKISNSMQYILNYGLQFSAKVCASIDNYIPYQNIAY